MNFTGVEVIVVIHLPCLAQKNLAPPTFSALANLVSRALTLSLAVVRGLMYGEMSSKVHLSLAAKRTESRS